MDDRGVGGGEEQIHVCSTYSTYKGGEEGLKRQGLGWVSPMGHGSPQRRGGLLVGNILVLPFYCFQMFALLSKVHTRLGWVSSWLASSWGPSGRSNLGTSRGDRPTSATGWESDCGFGACETAGCLACNGSEIQVWGGFEGGEGAIPYTVPY